MTTILAILFLSGNIISFEDGTSLKIGGLVAGNDETVILRAWIVSILLLAVPILSLILIFLYKNRRLQIQVTVLLIILIIALIGSLGWYSFDYVNSTGTNFVLGYKLALPILMLIFSLLAYKGIRKDEEIVRSYDRLR